MMQLTPQKIAAIRALADDARGDPATRAIAQNKLEQYRISHPELFEQWKPQRETRTKNPYAQYSHKNPGTQNSEDFERFRFMDLSMWGRTVAGNPTAMATRGGLAYRIILFEHKKTPTWGWLRIETQSGDETFSRVKFATMQEAHRDAWNSLSRI